MRRVHFFIVAGLVAALAGYGAYRYAGQRGAPAIEQPLPADLQFTDLDGHAYRLDHWRGKLLLVNFWATWCTPCLHEIPQLVKLQKKFADRGLQIIGPAVDDPDSVRSMVRPLGIDYPVMTGTPDDMIGIMEKLGNGPGGLPFSILVSPDGKILERRLGEFTPAELESLLRKYLPQ
ncbi:MAG: TlpA family protein disulfide reductase [Nevskia sp.]|nr:TlpA family protein disulfide reductase [Nevskia sp.]